MSDRENRSSGGGESDTGSLGNQEQLTEGTTAGPAIGQGDDTGLGLMGQALGAMSGDSEEEGESSDSDSDSD